MIGTSRTGEVERAVERIKPHLGGYPPEVQGIILADLLAIWLAGHQVEGDPQATTKIRGELLAHHLIWVEKLVTVNAMIIGTEP